MPRFSVVVPVYKAQEHLQECLDSVLGQSFTDLELIAVDDGSPDGCGAVLDACAATDRRVVPLHLPENRGPGPARNAGLEYATGGWLLFLDAHDTLAPGALRAVADRLGRTGEPDVLVFGHAREHRPGPAVRDEPHLLLSEEGPASFYAADRPGLLELPPTAWNKAYRREYVEKQGLRFPAGHHEELWWSYAALLAADTVAVLDRVCVHDRQRPGPGPLPV
ncbi:glycosyltransferase family 2 protein, partial [Streptomyces sp. GC420]|uniref:glycosyltransferase family 2 protein n=1 Tax=Streptomyces sp. GC420 TaxID=2697568 RepID=UPI0014152995